VVVEPPSCSVPLDDPPELPLEELPDPLELEASVFPPDVEPEPLDEFPELDPVVDAVPLELVPPELEVVVEPSSCPEPLDGEPALQPAAKEAAMSANGAIVFPRRPT
jgi:hypothetical protein